MILVRADAAGCAAVLLPGTKAAPVAAIAARLDPKRSFGRILFRTLFSLVDAGYGARGKRHRPGLGGAATRNGGQSDDPSCVYPGAGAAARCRGAGRTDGRQVLSVRPARRRLHGGER